MVPSPTQRSGCWDAQLEAITLGLLDTCWTQVLSLKVPASWDKVSKMASCFKKGGYRNKKTCKVMEKQQSQYRTALIKACPQTIRNQGYGKGKM